MGQPPSAYLDAQSPVERHDALADTLLLRLVGLDWKHPPSTTAKKKKSPTLTHSHSHKHITHNLSELPYTLKMTAKNRHKSSSGEKSPASSQDDAKKSPKTSSSSGSSSNGVSGPAPQGPPRSGSCLALVASTLFYIALIGAVGFAAFYLQQVVEEMRTTSAGQEESARLSAELASKMDSVVQQVSGEKK